MKKIIFVCLGNICRSPMAEFVMKDLLEKEGRKGEFEITSAGTSGEHNGESMHQGTKNKLNAKNIKAKNFISKKLTQKMCDESEMIIVMDNINLQNVKRCYQNVELKLKKMTDFAKNLGYDEVPDPWYSGDFDETYEIISCACKNLIKEL
ncbi:low molecular weight phosphotyrosine protein phosphatase [Campylobacter upsaliensis]